jgi:hypothetical protein
MMLCIQSIFIEKNRHSAGSFFVVPVESPDLPIVGESPFQGTFLEVCSSMSTQQQENTPRGEKNEETIQDDCHVHRRRPDVRICRTTNHVSRIR